MVSREQKERKEEKMKIKKLEFCKRTIIIFYPRDVWKYPNEYTECTIEGEIIDFLKKGDYVEFEYEDNEGRPGRGLYKTYVVGDKREVKDGKFIITRTIEVLPL